jgi:hypothetical protein
MSLCSRRDERESYFISEDDIIITEEESQISNEPKPLFFRVYVRGNSTTQKRFIDD